MNNRFAFLPMRSSTDLLGDPHALRARLAEDSYLYFPGLLDRERVLEVRRDVVRTIQELGWVNVRADGTDVCKVLPLREEDDEFIEGYKQVQRLQSFHALAHEPALVEAMQQVLGPTAFPHPLKIARLAFPDHYEVSTPPHQDFPNNQGTESLTATWIPITDITPELGGLAILRGSHRWGLLPMEGHIGAGNRAAVIPPEMAEACRWVTTDFTMGDVLLFPSLAVHASLHNASENQMRLSVDFRYQLEREPLTAGCLEPHFGNQTWEEIYAGWDDDRLKYYWKGLKYKVVPFRELPVTYNDDMKAVAGEIFRYKARVKSRTKRRLANLGIEYKSRKFQASSVERHEERVSKQEDPAPQG